jgi:hypothetical protein
MYLKRAIMKEEKEKQKNDNRERSQSQAPEKFLQKY